MNTFNRLLVFACPPLKFQRAYEHERHPVAWGLVGALRCLCKPRRHRRHPCGWRVDDNNGYDSDGLHRVSEVPKIPTTLKQAVDAIMLILMLVGKDEKRIKMEEEEEGGSVSL
jgi:hypothetical protein